MAILMAAQCIVKMNYVNTYIGCVYLLFIFTVMRTLLLN